MSEEAAVSTTEAAPPPEVPAEIQNEQDLFRGDTPENTQEEAPTQTEAKPEEPAVPKGVQKRIDRAVRQKYEAEARSKMLEERLAAIESRYNQPQETRQNLQVDPNEPRIEQYDNFDAYVAAKAAYIAENRINQTLTEREQRQAAEREATDRLKSAETFRKRAEKMTAILPDFEDVVANSDAPMTPPMRYAIEASEFGPQMAYHFANNPNEAEDIAQLSPLDAARAMGRLEERLSKPVEKKATSAPAPLTPIGGSGKVSKDPADMSQKEFEAWRRSVIKAR
jgi:hypothetical protein